MEIKSWLISKLEKDSIIEHQKLTNVNKNSKKLYNESIILIGPSRTGKSTIAEELKKKTGMQRLCLDTVAYKARNKGLVEKFENVEEFNSYMISEIIEKAKKDGLYGIVDFGGGHSVYDNREIFERVKSMLKPFKNIVLLLPDKDEGKSLDIMKSRAKGDIRKIRNLLKAHVIRN